MDRCSFVVALALVTSCLVPSCLVPDPQEALPAETEEGHDDEETGDCAEEQCQNDEFEPNEIAVEATTIVWDDVSTWNDDEFHDARVTLESFLCPSEHDWYAVPIAELGFEHHVVRVDGLVLGTSWCGHLEGCGGAFLPDAPANTIAVEVYDAASLVLLGSDLATNGRVDVNGWGVNCVGKDLLIHVYSPTAVASFAYELHVDVRSYDGEDECEC